MIKRQKNVVNSLRIEFFPQKEMFQTCSSVAKILPPPVATKKSHGKIIKGHAGAQLGLMELLWRRGHVDPNASKLPNDAEARSVAKNIPAFIGEPSEIEMTMKSLGVEVAFAPKGHCEIAGRGIECVWDVSKIIFARGMLH